jgi:peroxiredoxin Q/BCP
MTRALRFARKGWIMGIAAGALLVGGYLAFAAGKPRRPDGGSGPLPVGAQAPALTGTDQHGKPRSLVAERGHPVVVYFYPKDGTPGCTKEACAFRDAWEKFTGAGVAILGVSADSEKSHERFAKEERIPFPLIADIDLLWAKAFGVKTTLGMTSRVSFLLGPDGRVAKVYPDVDPGIHADEVLRDAQAL